MTMVWAGVLDGQKQKSKVSFEVFRLCWNPSEAIVKWIELTIAHQVRGKRAHDIKLLGLMLATGITHLVTFNPKDFPDIEGITIVDPADLVE